MESYKTKDIYMKETGGIKRINEPVAFGIPFKNKEIRNLSLLALYDEQGNPLLVQASSLGVWHDGSVKWALVEFQASVEANSVTKYKLAIELNSKKKEISIQKQKDCWIIDTGKCEFHINTSHAFLPFTKIICNGSDLLGGLSSRCFLSSEDKEITSHIEKLTVEQEGPLRSVLLFSGYFYKNRKNRLYFICRLHFFANKSLVKMEFTLRNPMAAYHPGGLWDLGDKGSFFFDELSFEIPVPDKTEQTIKYSLQKDKETETANSRDLLIYQESSGGKNWNSPNHVNQQGKVPLKLKGYEIRDDNKPVGNGERATPVVWLGANKTGISAGLTYFWQNFPKSLEIKNNKLSIGLFPKNFTDIYELQGGEQKTETIYFDFSCKPSELNWIREPLIPFLKPEEYERSGAIPNFKVASNNKNSSNLQSLINEAISGENSFFAKREVIDEFGWRHFGELYADHEAINNSDGYFISHYNNQYDLLFSAFRQFMSTNNLSWLNLAKELSAHVTDIDIYHTIEDRDEFNHGLFWHTDHYLDAKTCTHRTHSKEYLKLKPGACGGGPGPEHCYTTGLMYHYWFSGQTLNKEVVINLAEWSIKALCPPTTILGFLYGLKNEISLYKKIFKGERVPTHRYPLNRGTGNTMIACLDAFELTTNNFYIQKVEELMQGCVHPGDDIDKRDLLDAEAHWSYTVFFVSLGRYLDKKIEIEEIDGMYSYAQETLLNYAKWMLKNEYPYLEQKEILEYPNETWPAQDIRKSCVFYYAAKHAEGFFKTELIKKAKVFLETSSNSLQTFSTKSFTRPIALILQNEWVISYLEDGLQETTPRFTGKKDYQNKAVNLTRWMLCKRTGIDFLNAITKTTPPKEFHWLKIRLRSR